MSLLYTVYNAFIYIDYRIQYRGASLVYSRVVCQG